MKVDICPASAPQRSNKMVEIVEIALAHAIIAMKPGTCHVNALHRKRLANVLIAMKRVTCPVNVHRRDNKMAEIVEIVTALAIIAMKLDICLVNVPLKSPQNALNAVKRVTCHVNAQTAHQMKRLASVAENQDTVSVIAQRVRKIRLA